MKNTLEKLKVQHTVSIISVLEKMDLLRLKLLLVYDVNEFVGLVSVGDIQRAIIRNYSLSTPVCEILRKDFIVGKINESVDAIRQKMISIRAEFMPILDESNNVIKVVFWNDIIKTEKLPPNRIVDIPVVIMAGGKGMRLQPITNILPKPLIPIGDRPIVEHIMDRFVHVGCSNFLFSVNFKADMIKYYFTSISRGGYSIDFFEENKPLGTAGSLNLLKGKINSTFFVSNCDIIIDQDYSDIYDYHKKYSNELTLVAALKHYKIPYGTIESGENGILNSMVEKPDLTYKINAGLYILEPHLLDEIPEGEFFHITHLIDKIKKRNGRIGVFPVSEKSWRDIGEWDEYLKHKEC